jgi:hypothetical protein
MTVLPARSERDLRERTREANTTRLRNIGSHVSHANDRTALGARSSEIGGGARPVHGILGGGVESGQDPTRARDRADGLGEFAAIAFKPPAIAIDLCSVAVDHGVARVEIGPLFVLTGRPIPRRPIMPIAVVVVIVGCLVVPFIRGHAASFR